MIGATFKRRAGKIAWVAASAFPLAAAAGEGFYLGIEGGVNLVEDQTFKIYHDVGLITQPDGSTISEASFGTGYVAGLVAGYSFLNGLRPELELAYRRNDIDEATGGDGGLNFDATVEGYEHTDMAMANLWLDFNKSGSVHPYIGAGAGATRIEFRRAHFSGFELSDETDTVFAYQGGAGVGFDLGDHWTASLDYRYLRSSRGTFNFIEDRPVTEVKARYESHAAMIGLRYSFGEPEIIVPPAPEPPVQVVVVEPPPPPPPPPCELPAAGAPMTLEGCKAGDVIVLRGVNFDFDKDTLTQNAKVLLNMVGDALMVRTDIKVEVDGHTDAKGSDTYNQALSERRAESVRQYLVSHGIDSSRMTAKGRGETAPVADNATDEGRELNRRVELNVTEIGVGTVAPVTTPAGPGAELTPVSEPAPMPVPVSEPQPGPPTQP